MPIKWGVPQCYHKLGKLLGVSSSSVQIWRKIYETGGLSLLLEDNHIGFKPSIISAEEREQIRVKLNDSTNGLRGYVELRDWICREFNKDIKYNTLLKYCGRNFGSKSKIARKSHVKKDLQAVEDFKKNFGRICRNIYEGNKEKYKQVNLYFQDESRFGLFTKAGRMLTAKGIKPICSSHQEYSSTWLFGAFSPISGNNFMMEFPVCNTERLEISSFIDNAANEINKDIVISTCAYKYIFFDSFWNDI